MVRTAVIIRHGNQLRDETRFLVASNSATCLSRRRSKIPPTKSLHREPKQKARWTLGFHCGSDYAKLLHFILCNLYLIGIVIDLILISIFSTIMQFPRIASTQFGHIFRWSAGQRRRRLVLVRTRLRTAGARPTGVRQWQLDSWRHPILWWVFQARSHRLAHRIFNWIASVKKINTCRIRMAQQFERNRKCTNHSIEYTTITKRSFQQSTIKLVEVAHRIEFAAQWKEFFYLPVAGKFLFHFIYQNGNYIQI